MTKDCRRCERPIDEITEQSFSGGSLCWDCREADAEMAAENAWLVYAERPDFEDESYRNI